MNRYQPTDDSNYSNWVGKSETHLDTARAQHAAMLDDALGGSHNSNHTDASLQPLRHWLFFQPQFARAQTGVDGHPKKGGFLPPLDLPRRMWAASDVSFFRPLPIDVGIRKDSTIKSIEHKQGNSGRLIFVKVEHTISAIDLDQPSIVETQKLVYREDHKAPSRKQPPARAIPAPDTCDWQTRADTDEVLLFRYSALTANAHRIHYDKPYATKVEGYKGLVVQAPLQATLLVDAWQKQHPKTTLRQFSFRAIAPSFVGEPLTLCGQTISDNECELWIRRIDGSIGMKANLKFVP